MGVSPAKKLCVSLNQTLRPRLLCPILPEEETISCSIFAETRMDTLNFAWHWSPGALVALVILCLLYVLAVRQARGRDTTQPPVKKRHMLAFLSVIIIMALVLLTPLDTIARTQLFAAHMLQ